MSTAGLTPPGSATYDSNTMFVGDGTWDSTDNTFLLPNLQGLNYETTRYNGMGNRFKDLPGYYSMVLAHGVLAVITFLFIVPLAIMVNRFYWRNYYWKLRIHIWAQILTVFLSTVVFTLGFFQVGPRRSLTNPHHQIGLALYVLVLVQFIGGYLNYKRSKGRPQEHKMLRIVLHQWMGRVIGLLGIIQVALGLTLYGSPLSLFVLYAIMVFALVLAYFILDFVNTTGSTYHGDGGSTYLSGPGRPPGPPPEKPEGRGGMLKWLLAGGAIAALVHKFRGRRQPPGSEYGSEVYSEDQSHAPSGRPSTRPPGPAGQSHLTGQTYSEFTEKPEPKKHTWRNRLLGLGALGGLGYWLNRRKRGGEQHNDDDGDSYYTYSYSQTSGGGALSRVEEGRPQTPTQGRRPDGSVLDTPNSQDRLTAGRPGRRQSYSDMSESSYMSGSPSKYRPRHPIRDGLFGLGALGAAKGLFDWRKRRERKEQRRIAELRQQEAEDERLQRNQSRKFTGDGTPRRSGRHSRVQSAGPSAAPTASVVPSLAGASATAAPNPYPAAGVPYPGALPVPTAPGGGPPRMTGAIPQSSTSLAPPPPMHGPGSVAQQSVGSRPSTAGGPGRSFGEGSQLTDAAAAGLAGGVAGAALGGAGRDHRSRDNSRVRPGQETSPATPVSVKLNMHPDGRHVTLRRLTEEEAQKERESKRTRNRSRRRRAGSVGDGSVMSEAATSPDQRWRRQGQDSSPSAAPRPSYAASSVAGSAAAPPSAQYPAVPRPSAPPSSAASPAPYPNVQPHVSMPQPGLGSAGMSAASLQPPPSVSTLPGRRPSGAGLVSHPGSVASPGAYDTTTDTQASQMSNFAENRRRRRAQRAQNNLARQQRDGADNRSVDFE